MTALSPDAQSIRNDLDKINDVVAAARDLVNDGQVINVQPLEKEIERICANLDSLGGEDGRQIQPILLSLMDELDHLAKEMEEHHHALQKELETLSGQGKIAAATSAYTRPGGKQKK